ncbi:MAG: sulfatase-like hydrolase/transferase [Chthoniobacter sp.]|nr:sulfatase-like hydrolase/transferase [Chthoniobacter sp.]
MKHLLRIALCLSIASQPLLHGAETPKRPVNVLFIITDQQRWDTLGCMGNKIIKTPNLDRLAAGGARFTRMYSSCPVCVPARTVILTGHSCSSNNLLTNQEIDRADLPTFETFDQALIKQGYRGEYYGKWHSPYKYALDYANGVRWTNGKKPPGSRADMNEEQAFLKYLDEHVPARPLEPGEQLANLYNRPYRPDPLDGSYGLPPEQVQKLMRNREAGNAAQVGQGFTYGCLDVPPEHTLTAWTAQEGIDALDRLKDGPFTLTVSIGPPHPPMVLPKPYYGMYPATDMPVPASIEDTRAESPYFRSLMPPAYRDKDKVRQMISDYYGLITLDDDWIGKLLARLDELHLSDHTLVIFTADHGEMLGDHGMYSKFVFYEGSAHIPLLVRLPGVIPAGKVVDAPVAQIDLFSTILDYCGLAGHESEGATLRPLIEGKDDGAHRVTFSEWNGTAVPGYMVCDGRWKLMFGRGVTARARDGLFDLQSDPNELKNLLATESDRAANKEVATRLKQSLVDWLEKVKSPHLEEVRARPLGGQG